MEAQEIYDRAELQHQLHDLIAPTSSGRRRS